ncbi:MAG: 50S ribosomal protein L10 [Rhodospirillaceae bacterium]|nr:50S ribosomal protein L10 [Rhodospirillaceae bacterium]
MKRSQKEDKVAAMQEAFQDAELMIITHNNGMTVEQSLDLRRQMRAAGARFQVTKNRLARIALKGTAFEHLDGMFTGPTAVATAKDPVPAAKAALDYAKKSDKLTIVGGGLGGTTLDAAGIEALAKLPPIEELRSKLLGVLQAPASRLVGVMEAPAGQMARLVNAPTSKLVGVFKAYAAKQ